MSPLPTCHTIARGAVVRMSTGTRHRVTVLRGHVWATVVGDRTDYVLEAGQSATIVGAGLLIEALDDSCVSVDDVGVHVAPARPTPHLVARPQLR